MANEPVSTPTQSKYTDHLAAALAANQAEQAILTERLSKLQGEEKWLTAALADTPQDVGPEPAPTPAPVQTARSTPAVGAGTDAAAVPAPRTAKTAADAVPVKKSTAPRKTAAKKATAKAGATPAKKPVATKQTAAPMTATDVAKHPATAGPTLGQLLGAILSQQPGEPKKVSEIQSEFEATHPERETSVQTIRNALQSLVKKGELERVSQQGTVFYTWPVTEATPVPPDEAKAEETVPAAV
ncbi:hypothetical protein ACFVX6_32535 [Streptomyces sp. NPDC058289]|uniref:hypothetical protein n=1 Tax=Streptomyces sp. NPDC058289 TaxID=3346425 RepID=UPI0036F0E03B